MWSVGILTICFVIKYSSDNMFYMSLYCCDKALNKKHLGGRKGLFHLIGP